MQTATRQLVKRDMLNDQLREEIRGEVYKVLEDINYDIDRGLDLRPAFARKLKKRIASREKATPLAEIMRHYGIKV